MTDIPSIIKVFMEPGLKTGRPAQAALRPGTVLSGRITDILPSGLVQINFGKFRSQTRVRFPVAQGDTLRFEVLETGDPIKLKLQDPPPAAIEEPAERSFKPEDLHRFRQALEMVQQKAGAPWVDRGFPDSTRLLLTRLSNHLLPLQTGRKADQLVPGIISTLTNSGIFFEKRLETALLQIFKSPDKIHTDRAVSHPFITHIFDSDVKPNLLKLVATLAKTGDNGAQPLAALRETALKFLDHIDSQQTRLTHHAPDGSVKRSATYQRTDAPPPGRTDPGLKTLQLHLVKAGLWAEPEIRAATREFFRFNTSATVRHIAPTPANKAPFVAVTDRISEGATLRKTLTASLKSKPAVLSKSLDPLLKAVHAYVHKHQLRLDRAAEKALMRLENSTRKSALRASATTPGADQRTEGVKLHLRTLARFLETRPDTSAIESRQKPAKPASGRVPYRLMHLVTSRADTLAETLDRIDKELDRVLSARTVLPNKKETTRLVRALKTLISRHQLPADDAVNRALTTVGIEEKPSETLTPPTLKSGAMTEKLLQDLGVLREFVVQQRTELSEALDRLRVVLDRTAREADPGDRPGPERARGAYPVQVIAFALPMEEGQKPVRLKAFYPLKRRSVDATGFRISLLLSMQRMGPVRADLFAHRNNLEIKFSTENESAYHHINEHLNRLSTILTDHFENIHLTAAVDEKTIAAFEYEDLELSDNRLVNLQA